MGNAALTGSGIDPADGRLADALALVEPLEVNNDPERWLEPVSQQSRSTSSSEELLVEMWQRRSAVEQALRVSNELFAEAEGAAMQAYSSSQRSAGGAEALRRRYESAAQQGAALLPAEREATVAHLLEMRAALAEADLLAYAAQAASWADFIALNPFLALAAAARVDDSSAESATRSATGEASAGQSIRGGRRYVFSSPGKPSTGSASPQYGPRAQLLRDLAVQSTAQTRAAAPEAEELRDELARCRRHCAQLAHAEREARESGRAAAAAAARAEQGAAAEREQVSAAAEALAGVLAQAEALQRRAGADAGLLAGRGAALRRQLARARDAAEAARWDSAAAAEGAAEERARLTLRADALLAAASQLRDAAPPARPAGDGDTCAAEGPLRAALARAQASCLELAAQRDAAAAQARAAQAQLAARGEEASRARARAEAAEGAAARASAAQVHSDEAMRAAAAHRAALQAQLAHHRQRLEELMAAQPLAAGTGPPSLAPSEADWLSEIAASDAGSTMSDADMASLRASQGRAAKQRDEARLRAAQNKARFEAIKAERNSLRTQARAASVELEALRAEAARVEELRQQLRTVQSSLFL